MFNTVLSDFSRVLVFAKDRSYQGTLNKLYSTLKGTYNYFDYYEINQELLDFYRSLKNKHISLHIFTSGVLQNDPQIKPILQTVFNNIFSAGELGLSKADSQAYLQIGKLLNKKPEEIVFIDDQLVNVEAAREAGMQIVYFNNTTDTIKKLQGLIS